MLTVQHNCHFYSVGASGHVGGLNKYSFSLRDIPEFCAITATSIAAFLKNKNIGGSDGAQSKQTSVTVQVQRHFDSVRNIDIRQVPKRGGGSIPGSVSTGIHNTAHAVDVPSPGELK